jgi:hypothetical protein
MVVDLPQATKYTTNFNIAPGSIVGHGGHRVHTGVQNSFSEHHCDLGEHPCVQALNGRVQVIFIPSFAEAFFSITGQQHPVNLQ